MNREGVAVMACDGLSVEITYDDEATGWLLNFLLVDMKPGDSDCLRVVEQYRITTGDNTSVLERFDGKLKMQRPHVADLALPLLNATMNDFARGNQQSISLHAALVSDRTGSMLLPGAPNSGKSAACLWMTHLGMHYHTDELVTLNRQSLSMAALTRPFTFRRQMLDTIKASIDIVPGQDAMEQVLESEHMAWLAHRLINRNYHSAIPALKSIVFPVYTTGHRNELVEISRAHAGLELMRSHFQNQTFSDHGFNTISSLVRQVPVYLMIYNHFDPIAGLIGDLIEL